MPCHSHDDLLFDSNSLLCQLVRRELLVWWTMFGRSGRDANLAWASKKISSFQQTKGLVPFWEGQRSVEEVKFFPEICFDVLRIPWGVSWLLFVINSNSTTLSYVILRRSHPDRYVYGHSWGKFHLWKNKDFLGLTKMVLNNILWQKLHSCKKFNPTKFTTLFL